MPMQFSVLEKTDGTAVERKSGDCSRAEEGENGKYFRTKGEELPRVKKAGDNKLKMPVEEAVT